MFGQCRFFTVTIILFTGCRLLGLALTGRGGGAFFRATERVLQGNPSRTSTSAWLTVHQEVLRRRTGRGLFISTQRLLLTTPQPTQRRMPSMPR
jgi:hypothetical protein